MALAILGFASATAQTYSFKDNAWRTGNAFYTEYAKWEIQGTNLLANGDFTQGKLLLDDWANADGAAIEDNSVFQVIEGAGPNGSNAVEIISTVAGASASATTNGELFRTVDLEAGNYVIGYWVKGSTDRTIATSVGSTNAQALFLNNDGTKNVDSNADTGNAGQYIATKGISYGDTWKEIYYQFTISEPLSAQICFHNLQQGDQFANFGIYKVRSIFDERPILTLIDECKTYKNNPDFPNNQSDLDILIGALEEVAETGAGELEEAMELLNQFLNANTYLLSADTDYFSNFLITGNTGMNKGGTGWTTVGGRWGTSAAASNYNLAHFTDNFAFQDIQCGYNLDKGELYKEIPLPAGRYMFRAQVHGMSYQKGDDGTLGKNRAINFNDSVTCALFINNDTMWVKTSPTKYQEAIVYGEVKEGETLKFGVWLPGTTGNSGNVKKGGDQGARPLELRLLGGFSKAEIDDVYFGANARLQQSVLEERLTTAKEMLADDYKYAYGKKALKDSIDVAQAVYDQPVVSTPECVQTKLNAVNMIKKAWQAYEADNTEYTTLGVTMKEAEEHLADPDRTVKNKLQAVYDPAKAYRESITGAETTPEDSLLQKNTLVEWNDKLVLANSEFYMDNARLATPGDIALVNPVVSSANGWTIGTSHTGSLSYSEEWGWRYNRNYSAANDWETVLQDVAITRPGVYEFSATCAANKFKASYEKTYVFLETHQGGDMIDNRWLSSTEENPVLVRDSIMVCTPAPADDEWSVHVEDMVRLTTHVVVTDPSKPLTVGLNAARNNINGNAEACCQIIFGNCELKYLGDYATYRKDSINMVMKPTKDALQEKINELRAMSDEARNPNNVSTTPFTNALATAQGVHDNSEDIDEVNAQFDALEAARQQFVLSGVYPAEGKFYDLSFIIKNPTFEYVETTTGEGEEAVTKRTVNDWTETMAEGQTFNMNGAMLYGKNYIGVEEEDASGNLVSRTKLNQVLSGLPAGAFEFGFNATFHGDSKNNIYQVTSKEELYVSTPTDTVSCKPIVQEQFAIEGANQAYGTDQNSTYLVYNEGLKLLLYDYRHGTYAIPTLKEAFNQGYYLNMAKLDVVAGDTPEVGFYLQDMLSGDYNFFLMNPQLRYYGDDANRQAVIDERETQSIDALEMSNVRYSGTIYNLAGQKLNGKLQKGLYIMNGKKFVVK